MKLKLLNIFFVVLIAQTQGIPLELNTGTISILNGTVVQIVDNVGTQAIANINNAITAGSQLIVGDANLLINNDDPVATAEAHLANVANQVFQTIDNTLKSVSSFFTAITNIISNNNVLLSNPIGSIKQATARVKSTISSTNLIQIAANLANQANGLANPLPKPITFNEIIVFSTVTLPKFISSDLNALNFASNNIVTILTAALNLTNELAVPSGVTTAALNNSFNNIVTAVNNIPATINNAINSLQNAADKVETVCNNRLEEVISGFRVVGTVCVNDAITDTYDLAADAIGKAVSCVTDEIPTIQNYISQYQNLTAQYQAEIANNTISNSTLQRTAKTSLALYSYLITGKFKVEGCITAKILKASGILIRIAVSAVKCVV